MVPLYSSDWLGVLYVDEAGLKLVAILLPQFPKYWSYRQVETIPNFEFQICHLWITYRVITHFKPGIAHLWNKTLIAPIVQGHSVGGLQKVPQDRAGRAGRAGQGRAGHAFCPQVSDRIV